MRLSLLFSMAPVLLLAACVRTRQVEVFDASTRQPIAGATVISAAPSFNGPAVATNANGTARPAVSPTDDFIIVSKPGYLAVHARTQDKWPLKVPLVKEPR